MKSLITLGLATALIFSMSAQGGIIPVSKVMASSTFAASDVQNLINGQGLEGELHSGEFADKWMGEESVQPSLIFDLGVVFEVASTMIWNYGGCCDIKRNAKQVVVFSSVDGINFTQLGKIRLAKTKGELFAGQNFDLDTFARYIRLDIKSNYGDKYTGLSEVQFTGNVASAPEPVSMLLMLLGLAGLAIKSRNQTVAV